jgi:hypothetical protein
MRLWDGRLDIKSNFIFETYVVRGVAWIVGVIPVTVLAMGAKLAIFPLLVFKVRTVVSYLEQVVANQAV